MTPPPPPPPLRLLFWESTSRCNLTCDHCRRLDTDAALAADDLSTAQARALLESLAELARTQAMPPIFVFSGGEPLLREDWPALAGHAAALGLPTALATNGTLVDAATAHRIAQAGVRRVSVSLDGPDAATHDAFRRSAGSFAAAMAGVRHLRGAGVEVQINATIARHNLDRLDELHALALHLDVAALHLFLLVPVGCGADLDPAQRIGPAQYERVLEWIAARNAAGPLPLKATCAPHYFRIRPPGAGQAPHGAPHAAGALHSHTRGCLGGIGVAFVSHRGEVFPCGYLPVSAGDVRERPFDAIWRDSPVFADLRDFGLLRGKCGRCDHRDTCGGCRARAYAATGHYLDAEPMCAYRPPES